MSRPTRVQREILALMARGEEIVEGCHDHNGPSVGGDDRHFPWRTFDILRGHGWIAPYTAPPCSVGYWFITDAGRATLGNPLPPTP